MNKKKLLNLVCYVCLVINILLANSPQNTKTGVCQVIDSQSSIPVIGAHVWVSFGFTTNLTITDNEGFFKYNSLSDTVTVKISHICYKTSIFKLMPDGKTKTIKIDRNVINFPDIEVSAISQKVAIDEVSLSSITMSKQPLPFDDAFRGLHALPGITSNGYDGTFYIRGGLQNELLVELDGHTIDRPFHFDKFPFGPVHSFISYQYLRNMELSLGGFSSSYGDKMSGLLRMNTLDPDSSQFMIKGKNIGGSFGADILSTNGVLFGAVGLKKYGNVKWLLTGRHGHLDNVFELTEPDFKYNVDYRDLFFKVIWELSEKESLGLYFLSGYDKMKQRNYENSAIPDSLIPSGPGFFNLKLPREVNEYTSNYYWLKYEKMFSARFGIKSVLSFDTHEKESTINYDFYSTKVNGNYSLSGISNKIIYNISHRHLLKFGFDINRYNTEGKGWKTEYIWPTDYNLVINNKLIASSLFDSVGIKKENSSYALEGYRSSAYFSDRIIILPTLSTELGFRIDHITLTEDIRINPRLIFVWDIGLNTKIQAAFGLYDQSPDITDLNYTTDGKNLFLNSKELKPDKAIHYLLNMNHTFNNNFSMKMSMYFKDYTKLENQAFVSQMPEPAFLTGNPEKGRAYGIEIYSRFQLLQNKLSGWSSYSLSKTEIRLGEIIIPNGNGYINLDGQWTVRNFDQRHTLTTVLNYTWIKEWNLGVQMIAHSGRPYSELNLESKYKMVDIGDGIEIPEITAKLKEPNNSRYPINIQLDIKFKRRFQSKIGIIDIYIGMLNILNEPNYNNVSGNTILDEINQTVRVKKEYEPGIEVTPFVGFVYNF